MFQGRRVGPLTDALTAFHHHRMLGGDAQQLIVLFDRALAPFTDQLVFISDEMLLGFPAISDGPRAYADAQQRIAVLAELFRISDVEVVVVIRNQADFLESIYLQGVQQASLVESFDRFFNRIELGRPDVAAAH